MVKPGLLHEANGGYLIVLAKDILTMPYAWKGLMRAMLDDEIAIESLSGQAGAIVSTTLKPQPIPLDVKIILIGDPYTYQILYYYDEEFRKLFKIMADFDIEMNRNADNIDKIARFIAKHCHEDGLRHFTRHAVARIIENSSRLADDQNKLSSHLNQLVDLIYESDSWASEDGSEMVEANHVDIALEMLEKRNNKIEEKVFEMFESGDYLLDVSGEKIGEINGLAVTGSGQYQFGKPTKITVSTYRGRAGIINIEREARTSGAIHDKGVMIISGYLGHKFAQNKPLALTASIVFEQLYSGIDGDSASSTELYALLSSLSGLPIRQSIAVTGSVNQRGEIQPIGGVNEKILGYFKVCKLKGLTGDQGVIIPYQNVKNLMLSQEIIDAVKAGRFHIYSVKNIDEGIEILTGIKAGKRNQNGTYTKNSVYDLVDRKLNDLIKPSLPEIEAIKAARI
jgi:lon-related putative ATP-dependent protease